MQPCYIIFQKHASIRGYVYMPYLNTRFVVLTVTRFRHILKHLFNFTIVYLLFKHAGGRGECTRGNLQLSFPCPCVSLHNLIEKEEN